MRKSVYHVETLQRELDRRKARNPRFSLRAFASKLQMHPSALSRILSGKQALTPDTALVILEEIELPWTDQLRFLRSVAAQRYQAESQSLADRMNTDSLRSPATMEICAAISDSVAHEILKLAAEPKFQSNLTWISEQLRLPIAQVEATVAALLEVKVLLRDIRGNLKPTRLSPGASAEGVRNLNRKHQSKLLREAEKSMTAPSEITRHFCNLTLKIRPEKVATARELLTKLMEQLSDQLGDEEGETFNVAVQLFPSADA